MSHTDNPVAHPSKTLSQGRLYTEILSALETGTLKLQSLPGSLLTVMNSLKDNNASAGRVAQAARADMGLTEHLLRVVNSPIYRAIRPITELDQAVSRLGMGRVQNLTTTYSMKQLIQTRRGNIRALLDDYWSHSTRVGTTAYVLAHHTRQLDPNDALFYGVTHNIGVMPILDHLSRKKDLDLSRTDTQALVRRVYPHAGVSLLRHWNLDEERVNVIREHLNFQRNPGRRADMTDVVLVGNLFAWHERGVALTETRWEDLPAFGKFGMQAKEFVSLLPTLSNTIDEFQAYFFAA